MSSHHVSNYPSSTAFASNEDGMIPCQSTPEVAPDHGPEVLASPLSSPSVGPPNLEALYPDQYGHIDQYGGNAPTAVGHHPPPKDDTKIICGAISLTQLLSILLVLVIAAAAVGGGIGGSSAVRNARQQGFAEAEAQCTCSETESSPTSVGLPIPTEGILPLDCPTIDGRIQTVDIRGRKSDFRATCGNDIGPGNDGIITAVVVYSLGHCLRACAAYNGYREQAGVLDNFECNAVNFQASLDLGDKGGNCYLLWNVVDDNNFDEDLDGERVAAILVS